MNKSCKICWTILVVFFIANVALLSLWWLKSEKEGAKTEYKQSTKDRARIRLKDHFRDELKMDEKQFDQFNKMRTDHMNRVSVHQQQIDSVDMLLKDLTFSDLDDNDLLQEYTNEIAEHQKEIELLNYRHYKRLRAECSSEEQRQNLDEMFRRLIEKKHKRHHMGKRSRNNK